MNYLPLPIGSFRMKIRDPLTSPPIRHSNYLLKGASSGLVLFATKVTEVTKEVENLFCVFVPFVAIKFDADDPTNRVLQLAPTPVPNPYPNASYRQQPYQYETLPGHNINFRLSPYSNTTI